MVVTKIRYYDVDRNSDKSRFLARCSVFLDDSLVLHDIKLFNGKKGRYIIMPCRVNNNEDNVNDNMEDLFHPVDRVFSDYLTGMILEGYQNYEDSGSRVFIP